jgi:hypothetical protein
LSRQTLVSQLWPSTRANTGVRPHPSVTGGACLFGTVANVQWGGLEITVEAVSDGRPTQVLFRFPGPIESGAFRLLVWRAGRLEALPLPAIGGRLALGNSR